MLFEYCVPNISAASWGGVLFTPIQDLTLALGDTGVGLLNLLVYETSDSVITIDLEAESFTDYLKKFNFVPIFLPGGIKNLLAGYVQKKIFSWAKRTFTSEDFKTQIDLPISLVTPDKIFSNKINLLDVNIINPRSDEDDDAAHVMQSTIAKWYVILRNIATVAFLSMLVYVGIRIILSSAASDKAKYKQLLKDWVIGLCMLFLMHYGMSFALTINEKFIEFVDAVNPNTVIEADGLDFSKFYNKVKTDSDYADLVTVIDTFNTDDKGNTITDKLHWRTDLTGYLRFYAQSNIKSFTVPTRMGYTIMYLVAVVYTWLFFIKYLKRLIYIIFLTLISPMVAMLYPLDKMSDGSAQTFNMWFKEYIFNLLIQPVHLILYTVLIGSALSLVGRYPIYALVVYGFMLQSEKFVRKMFGFDKASIGSSAAGGAFTGAMVMSGLNKAVNMAKGHKLPEPNGKTPRSKEIGSGDDGKVAYANNRTKDSSADDIVEQAFLGSNPSPSPTENNDEQENPTDGFDPSNNDNEVLNLGPTNNQDDQNGGLNGGPTNNQDGQNGELNGGPANNQNDQNGGLNGAPTDTQDVNPTGAANNKNGQILGSINNDKVKFWPYGSGTFIVPKTEKEQKRAEKKQIKKEARKMKGRKFVAGSKAYALPALKKAAKAGVKMAGMAALGTTGAMIGVAAGLATDDMSNVVKYGAAGITGGAAIGNVAANNVISRPKIIAESIKAKRQEATEKYASELYKDDPDGYKDYLNRKSDNEFLTSKEIRKQYAREFGEENAVKMMRNALKYREQGITDNKIIINAMKESSGEIGKTDVTDSRRIAAAKLATGITGSKDIENMTKRLTAKGYDGKLVSDNEEFVRSIKEIKYN